MADYIQQLIAPKYFEMQSEVERQLAAIGLTPDDLSRRAHCVIRNGVTTYFFDGKPFLESEISFHENVVKFEVRMVTNG